MQLGAQEIGGDGMDVYTGSRVAGGIASVEVAQSCPHGMEGRVIDHSRSDQFVLGKGEGISGKIPFKSHSTI